MPPFDLNTPLALPSLRPRGPRGVGTSGAIPLTQLSNLRRAATGPVRPFEGATGSLTGAFAGLELQPGFGQQRFGELSGEQRRIGRSVAFEQFFNPVLSGQQSQLVEAVRKNRIARGLRGRAVEGAGEAQGRKFLEANRRSALEFIRQDVGALDPSVAAAAGFGTAGGGLDLEQFLTNTAAFQLLSRAGIAGEGNMAQEARRATTGSAFGAAQQRALTRIRSTGAEVDPDLAGQLAQASAFQEGLGRAGGDVNRAVEATRDVLFTGPGQGRTGASGLFEAFRDVFPGFQQGFISQRAANQFAATREGRMQPARQGTEGFLNRLGAGPAGVFLADLQEQMQFAQGAQRRGTASNIQQFITSDAERNRPVSGEELQALAGGELEFLRGTQSQLEELRRNLFSPVVF